MTAMDTTRETVMDAGLHRKWKGGRFGGFLTPTDFPSLVIVLL
jgi:hypothetical protein